MQTGNGGVFSFGSAVLIFRDIFERETSWLLKRALLRQGLT